MIYVKKILVSVIDDDCKTHKMELSLNYSYLILQYEDAQAIITRGEPALTQAWKLFEALTIFAKHEPEFIATLIRAIKGDAEAFDKIGRIFL